MITGNFKVCIPDIKKEINEVIIENNLFELKFDDATEFIIDYFKKRNIEIKDINKLYIQICIMSFFDKNKELFIINGNDYHSQIG